MTMERSHAGVGVGGKPEESVDFQGKQVTHVLRSAGAKAVRMR
ncbi:hypothetical protein BraRD5C2_40030 [Bradyrhizobium sp. RD5-C2]|nr:hypothetical protein BraRD5C2_40030 [Bradyrhizobium sp. RD5-C2]